MNTPRVETDVLEAQQSPPAEAAAEAPAWQEVAEGRYMPRRVRGSCRGRVLG